MAQVKKPAIRGAILDAAFDLFAARGYSDTTMSQIAAQAGVSVANIYVYFGSKLEIVYAIFDPWLRERLGRLQSEADALADPQARLGHILITVWRDIPRDNNAFMSNVMQAVATATPEQGYNRDLLSWAEARVGAMIERCLPSAPSAAADAARLAQIIFMALDGFAMNERLGQTNTAIEDIAATFVERFAVPHPVVVAS